MTNTEENTAAPNKSPILIVAVAAFAAFIATFNETFMNVGFAPIMEDLHVGPDTVQWLATGYMLAAAVMVPVSAFAYRSIPTKPLFMLTTGLLLAGSIVGALSSTFTLLLVGRIIQGLGTGMLIPVGMNITLEAAPREKLGTYMGVMGSMTTLGPSSSVIIAGALLSFWHWPVLQWTFAGLSLLCFLFGALCLPNIAKLTKPKLDAASVALVGLALVGVLYGVSTVFAGSIPVAAGAVVLGLALLVLFVKRQGRLEQPLIDLSPLSVAPFRLGVLINMASLVTMFAMNIIIPIFMQSVLGLAASSASITLFPAIALCCVLSPIAGRIYDKRGARVLLPLGFVLIAVFAVALALFIGTGSIWLLALLYVPVIGGSALIIGPAQSLALSHLAPEQNPHGVTILSTGFQIAGCIGASLFTGVYSVVTAANDGETGFLAAGGLTAVFALLGLVLAIRIGHYAKAVVPRHEGATFDLSTIMKTDVFALAPTDRVEDALRTFVDKGISGAPVVSPEGKVVGFISDGDIMRFLAHQHTDFTSPWSIVAEKGNDDFDKTLQNVLGMSVAEIATRHVISVNHDDDLGTICKTMIDHHLRKAPVLQDGRMVGIINRSNISNYAISSYLK
ncbi:MAG: MFS transporter [Propionibacteriaceae bacterium]|jgi:DHA2 family lincomycin resistance protein-like MFS transporter|nr:MFS transporter [Propionibacteriaceae bacterium]